MDIKQAKFLYESLIQLLQEKESQQDLIDCGYAELAIFCDIINELSGAMRLTDEAVDFVNYQEKAEALADHAQEVLLLFPYKDVPVCWRRLVMDAGLLKAVCILGSLIHEPNHIFNSHLESLGKQLIEAVDVAMVVSGAPGHQRREMAFALINPIQEWLSVQRKIQQPAPLDIMIHSDRDNCALGPNLVNRLENPPGFLWFAQKINVDPYPFIIPRGALDDWPAFSTRPWSLTYFLTVAADRIVPVEIGSQYTDSTWQQQMMRFEDFVRLHILTPQQPPAYLAQHDLFYQIPKLADDIIIPDYCYCNPEPTALYDGPPPDVLTNAWFGPKGTVSPLHHDPYHNLLAQVIGTKYIRLYAPSESDKLYPHEGIMENTSQVDIQNPDLDTFPEFKNATFLECVLNPGEMLYIPVRPSQQLE